MRLRKWVSWQELTCSLDSHLAIFFLGKEAQTNILRSRVLVMSLCSHQYFQRLLCLGPWNSYIKAAPLSSRSFIPQVLLTKERLSKSLLARIITSLQAEGTSGGMAGDGDMKQKCKGKDDMAEVGKKAHDHNMGVGSARKRVKVKKKGDWRNG